MAKVNKKYIESIFNKIHKNFNQFDYSQKNKILKSIEKKAKILNGKNISDVEAIAISFEKIKYHFARIYGEGKAKSTLVNLKKSIDFIEYGYSCIKSFKDEEKERELEVIKDLITFVEISLNMDISFYTSLLNLYQVSLEKDNLSFNHFKLFSERRQTR